MKRLLLVSFLMMCAGQVFVFLYAVNGKALSYTCTGCHGIKNYMNAYPVYHVPKLGGQNEGYIAAALKAYRSGERSHPTMKAQAGSLSDQDIADIASYFASLNK